MTSTHPRREGLDLLDGGTVTTDVELRGRRLREGDQVMLFYPSAPGEALPLRPSNFVISGAMPVRFAPTPATA